MDTIKNFKTLKQQQTDTNNRYQAFIHCNNCGQPAITNIPKQVSIGTALFDATHPDPSDDSTPPQTPPCPYCGLRTEWEPGIGGDDRRAIPTHLLRENYPHLKLSP